MHKSRHDAASMCPWAAFGTAVPDRFGSRKGVRGRRGGDTSSRGALGRFAAAILIVVGSTSLARPQAPVFEITEVAPGVFVHFGVNDLMTAENEGWIADFGLVIGGESIVVLDTGCVS